MRLAALIWKPHAVYVYFSPGVEPTHDDVPIAVSRISYIAHISTLGLNPVLMVNEYINYVTMFLK